MENSLCLYVNSMELETREIARGLRRRDPDLLDELIRRRVPDHPWLDQGPDDHTVHRWASRGSGRLLLRIQKGPVRRLRVLRGSNRAGR